MPLRQLPEQPQQLLPQVQQQPAPVPRLQHQQVQQPVVLLPVAALAEAQAERQHLQTLDASQMTSVAAKTVAKVTNQTKV